MSQRTGDQRHLYSYLNLTSQIIIIIIIMKTAAKIKEELSQPNEKSDAKQDRILTYSMVQSPS